MSKIHRFGCFIIIRVVGADLEIHVVGASGRALDENVDLIGDLIGGALKRGELSPLPEDHEDCEIQRLGNHPDVATGIRLGAFNDAVAVQKVLEGTFDDVLFAHL